jgi:hypothetical protein
VSAPRTGASPAEGEEIAAAQRMHEFITRSLLVQAIFVASRLRIPDLLTGAAKSAEELAAGRVARAHRASVGGGGEAVVLIGVLPSAGL